MGDGAVDLSNPEERERAKTPPTEGEESTAADGEQPQEEQATIPSRCAFIVFETADGQWLVATLDTPVTTETAPTLVDLRHAACDIANDMLVADTINKLQGAQAAMAGQMMQRMEQQRLLEAVQRGEGMPGGVPGAVPRRR